LAHSGLVQPIIIFWSLSYHPLTTVVIVSEIFFSPTNFPFILQRFLMKSRFTLVTSEAREAIPMFLSFCTVPIKSRKRCGFETKRTISNVHK